MGKKLILAGLLSTQGYELDQRVYSRGGVVLHRLLGMLRHRRLESMSKRIKVMGGLGISPRQDRDSDRVLNRGGVATHFWHISAKTNHWY